MRNISWAGPSTPLAKVTNPRLAFDRLFGGFDIVIARGRGAAKIVPLECFGRVGGGQSQFKNSIGCDR